MKGRFVVALLVVFFSGLVLGRWLPSDGSPTPTEAVRPLPGELGEEERRGIEIYRRATASVVHITTTAVRRDLYSSNSPDNSSC